jgi:hypothetical protein
LFTSTAQAKEQHMKLNDIFPSNYIKAADLQKREVSVVIASAEVEPIGDERKLVLKFQGRQKGMICNKTNANRIAYAYGEDTDAWVGKEIVLYPDLVDFQGRTVEAIRVRTSTRPQAPELKSRSDMDDEIGF